LERAITHGSADVDTGPSAEFTVSEAELLRTGSDGGDVDGDVTEWHLGLEV